MELLEEQRQVVIAHVQGIRDAVMHAISLGSKRHCDAMFCYVAFAIVSFPSHAFWFALLLPGNAGPLAFPPEFFFCAPYRWHWWGSDEVEEAYEDEALEEDATAEESEQDSAPCVREKLVKLGTCCVPGEILRAPAIDPLGCGRIEDGGGVTSTADWRAPPEGLDDSFEGLRSIFERFASEFELIPRLEAGWKKGAQGLLNDRETLELRKRCTDWLGAPASLQIKEGQPMALDVLQALLQRSNDRDTSLPSHLRAGVRTGVLSEIEPSGLFPVEDRSPKAVDQDLRRFLCNWKSAESEPEVVQELLDKEVAEDFVDVWDEASWPELDALCGGNVAVGKLALAYKVRLPYTLL